MSHHALNDEQFGRARSQVEYEQSREHPGIHRLVGAQRELGADVRTGWDYGLPEQHQLFDPSHLPAIPAHHQLPEEFNRDPRTWFHGRVMRTAQPKAPKGAGPEGFHAGSRPAAVQRLRASVDRRGLKEDMTGRMFALRATGGFEGGFREEPPQQRDIYGKGSIKHYDLGGAEKGYRYQNEVEDAGSVSIGAPQRAGYLSTHREMVTAAKARGEYVHPNVAWAAQHYPEHTGESGIVLHRRYSYPKPEHEQLRLPMLDSSGQVLKKL